MIFLLDTNAFSDLMREHPTIEVRMAALSDQDDVIICPVVRGEILYGIARLPMGKRRTDLQSKADTLFAVSWRLPIHVLTRIYKNATLEGITVTAWVERALEDALKRKPRRRQSA